MLVPAGLWSPRLFLQLTLLALVLQAASGLAAEPVDYLRDIKPLLTQKCYACHGALKQQSSLRMDTAAAIRQGGDSGPAVVPGKPAESLLLGAITGDAGFQMPPEGQGVPLKPDQVDLVRRWIEAGAAIPTDESPQLDPRAHWSFQSPSRPPLPLIDQSGWSRNAIDAFIAERHNQLGLAPSPPAPPEVLLRRIYLDLVGIPPSPSELNDFLQDPSDAAYQAVVEQLLASPLYGQRWGRHWMDVWRYSDWYGRRPSNEIRYSMRHIWRWRDWIVDSLNADHGYDRLLTEMLAGDEVAPQDPSALAATGFLGRNWYKFDRNTWLFETVERTGQSLLGMSFRCCRCHDHKFDPVSQLEYYQFRAFFEPHDVRTDPVSASPGTETDNGKSQVLSEGLSHIFDSELDAPTYLFIRGDDRNPDKSAALVPGVPAAMGVPLSTIEPVSLPLSAFYPALQQPLVADRQQHARLAIEAASVKVSEAQSGLDTRKKQLADFIASQDPGEPVTPVVVLHDDFTKATDDQWEIKNGDWKFEQGKLVQSEVTSFATIVAKQKLPIDVEIEVSYRTLAAGDYRSVGFSYDYIDGGNSQDIYTSTGDETQTVQAFHRKDGKQEYPPAGIVKLPLKVGDLTVVRITARGQSLTIWLNGELKLQYQLPLARTQGQFALWVHRGAAEFEELMVRQLVPSREDYERRSLEGDRDLALAQIDLQIAELDQQRLAARVAAESARYGTADESEVMETALVASRLALQHKLLQIEKQQVQAHHLLTVLKSAAVAGPTADSQPAVEKAKLAVARLEQQHEAASQAVATSSEIKYEPLGKLYPVTSSGRRMALARWLTDAQHPRTSRVAVNHIWLRHFGEGLVPSVADFGLHGKPPSHPELLDWLAIELIDNGWQMKHLHRLLVLSTTYRMTSATVAGRSNQQIDRDNRFLWRMNYRRMEAEVVRDSILSTAGMLDTTPGGPDLDQTLCDKIPRRSMYFRTTPDDKMEFLELFDLADPNACFRRAVSVIPQQALAISNSALGLDHARLVARQLSRMEQNEEAADFIQSAYRQLLNRDPRAEELELCLEFLQQQVVLLADPDEESFAGDGQATVAPSDDPALRARENLLHVLYNHSDFITIR